MTSDQELLEVFRAEVSEQIEQLRQILGTPSTGWDLQLLFRLSHNIKGAARMVEATAVRDAAHALEDLFSELRAGTPCSPDHEAAARGGAALLEGVFLDGGASSHEALRTFRESIDRLSVAPAGTREAIPETTAVEERVAAQAEALQEATLRVSIDKLDRLMEFTSELVAAGFRMEERIAEAVELQSSAEALAKAGAADRTALKQFENKSRSLRRDLVKDRALYEQISSQLRDAIRLLRMVRVDSMRTVFNRVLRDAANIDGKGVELRLEGGDTEIDRTVLESLRDPLIHLLRNAVAHGIELPEVRAKSGKPHTGTVTLRAVASGGWVDVRVSDDGAGFNWNGIRARAIERGLLGGDEPADENTLTEYLFAPGFSTASTVTELAGRGVGLDVVRQNVTLLGGSVKAVDDVLTGAAFEMRVPLTRLTTKGILVRLGDHYFAVPINAVERTVAIDTAALREIDGRAVATVHGLPVPVVALDAVFQFTSDGDALRPAIILRNEAGRMVVLVDEVLGEKEFVVQRLSWNIRRLRGVSGVTVLDGGRICVVLDAGGLIAARGAQSVAARSVAAATERKRILVVDDSITTRTLEKNILGNAGFDVTLAVDGEEAWKKLSEAPFDLLISDVEMPRLNGLDLTRRVRADDRFQSLPVILVTSLGNDDQKMAGAEAGANAYIVKGEFDQDTLLTAVGRLL